MDGQPLRTVKRVHSHYQPPSLLKSLGLKTAEGRHPVEPDKSTLSQQQPPSMYRVVHSNRPLTGPSKTLHRTPAHRHWEHWGSLIECQSHIIRYISLQV